MEIAAKLLLRLAQTGERRLRHDGLQKRGHELQQQALRAGSGQAACAKRGESSNSSIGGSSSRITRRHVPAKAGMGQQVWLGGALVHAQADLAFHHRDAVHPLAAMLIGQLEEAKAFARQVESAMDTPELVLCLTGGPSLKDRGGVDDTDEAAISERLPLT